MTKLFHYNDDQKIAIIGLRVKANAKINKVEKYILINNKAYLRLSVRAVPEKGKANEEIINFLSKEWKIIKSNLEIISGQTSNIKLLSIKNIDSGYLNLFLNHYIE